MESRGGIVLQYWPRFQLKDQSPILVASRGGKAYLASHWSRRYRECQHCLQARQPILHPQVNDVETKTQHSLVDVLRSTVVGKSARILQT